MYKVVIHDEPARDCTAEFNRCWDALEYAKSARDSGYTAEVLKNGVLVETFLPHVRYVENHPEA